MSTNAANSNKRTRSYRWVWWVAALAVVGALIAWSATRPPEVIIAAAEYGDLAVTVTATGDVDGRVAEVSPLVQGQVEAIYRDEGDWVSRGELLARIVTGPSMASGATSRTVYETVQAPFDGVVSRRYVDPGDSALPGRPLFQVADAGDIWVTAQIDDIDIGKVREGQAVEIVLPAYLGQSLPGQIEWISATATPRTEAGIGGRVVRARIALSGGTGPLRPGMEVDVTTEATIARDVLLVPADAVIEDETGRWVLLAEGDTVARRDIVLGANNYVHAQVVEGLAAGDLVIVEGKEDVEAGDRVRTRVRDAR